MASQIRKNNRAQQRQVDREQAIGFVHDFLSGQLSILWLFILGNDIPDR